MIAALSAGVLAALAAGCVVRGRSEAVLRRRLQLRGPVAETHTRRWGLPVAMVPVVALAAVVQRPHFVILGLVVLGVTAALLRLLQSGRARQTQTARRSDAVELCDGLVAELRAGQPPLNALRESITGLLGLEALGHVVTVGGDAAQALRSLARQPGAESLHHIAAGWEVAQRSGAGLADVLDRLSASLRDDEDVRREVAGALGPPRATARLLAALPVFGAVLGIGLGADPLGMLLGSTLGAMCLATGAALAVAGLFWVERIAAAAEV